MRIRLAHGAFCVVLVVGCKSRPEESVPEQALAPVASASLTTRPVLVPPSPATSAAAASTQALNALAEPTREAEDSAFVDCEADTTRPAAVLDLASKHYRRGAFPEAAACAALATDLMPQAVEAQHLRAAALTGLARYDDAQVAFAMALVLDPDDPETLADVADFYINILPPKRRQTIQVGLEYARRGGERALTRRRLDRSLQGRLLLLEAQAHNDLSEPDLALPKVEAALELAPDLAGAEHELAVSLFSLLYFEDSERSFLNVLSRSPDDPYAHHHLGLIYERLGRESDAEAHFARARALAPAEFFDPVILDAKEFRREVLEAIAELPPELATLIAQVELELSDVPLQEDLRAASPPFAPTILGLFRGLPAGVEATRARKDAVVPSRAVVLYRKNLGRAVRSRAELDRQIRKTLRHEVGHLQGYDEDELRRRGLE